MVTYRRQFDAKKYWEAKPYCAICKKHKVKNGVVCNWCKKLIMEKGKIISKKSEELEQEKNIPIPKPIRDKVESGSANQTEDATIEKTLILSDEAHNKVVRLFTYLEKVLALDDFIIRDFRESTVNSFSWWLQDFPRDAENLYIREFDTEITTENIVESNAWVRVEKRNIKSAPELPKELVEWVGEVDPLNKPKTKDKIDRHVRFDDDDNRVTIFRKFRNNFKQGDKAPESILDWVILSPNSLPEPIEVKYIEDKWESHSELDKLFNDYIENDWMPWSENVKKIYKANLLYDQLYALRLLLKSEGDGYELLLGHGLLTWKHPAVGSIYTPIFLTPLTLDFDASKRSIEVCPDPTLQGFTEISPLSEMNNPAEMDLVTWSDKINAKPFDFWHLQTLKTQSQTIINYISTKGEDHFDDEYQGMPEVTENPSIWNFPVIFVRKRNNDLWTKYAGIIRRDIDKNAAVPTEFITDLVGEYNNDKELGEQDGLGESTIEESELFFPLPWNEEQKRIAERLDDNYGVVVKGPPGTGKSHTIANLISRFLSQGKSVLVTSQTSKALEVLRDKLPENIRSLAVSQLHQTAKRDDILQQSIGEISSNLGERYTKFNDSKVVAIKKEIDSTRKEKAAIANQLRQYILTDSSEKIDIDGEEIRPIGAAKFVNSHIEDPSIAWFTDDISFDSEINIGENDLRESYDLLVDLEPQYRGLFKFELPDTSSLPNEKTVCQAFSSYKELNSKMKLASKTLNNFNLNLEPKALSDFEDQLLTAKKTLNSINQEYEREIFDKCAASENERSQWQAILSNIKENIDIIASSNKKVIGHSISGSVTLPNDELLEGIEILQSKLSGKKKLGSFGKMILPKNSKKILENYKVDGFPADNHERADILQASIAAKIAENEIKTILKQSLSPSNGIPELQTKCFDLVRIEVLAENLQKITNYYENYLPIDTFCKEVKPLSELLFTRIEDIDSLLEIIASHSAKFKIAAIDDCFSEWSKAIDIRSENRHEICDKLLDALKKQNSNEWKIAISELNLLKNKRNQAISLNEIANKIKRYAPNLYQDIIGLSDQKQKFDCPKNLSLAWKVSRLESWLGHIHDHLDIGLLQEKLERLTKKEHELNSDLVTIIAWQRQIDKVTKKQRDALMAWSDAMKKYGKGTGKWAFKWLHAAQDALKEARSAVPVWIMPLYRAAQMFSEPKAGMFDVVIFDEASQCDIRGLTIGYLGKKILVVGDPDQISPAGIFQDQEKTFDLISRYLTDIPHKENFSITSSFFDLAKIRIPNMVQLNEHFRCVPEIIAFSNHYIYESKLKPLRYPNPKGMLKPALVPVFIENGYQNTNNKVNEPEAKAIVEKLVECISDPNYQKRPDGHLCNFGIVSLLAEDQAKYIKDLILKHPKIGEKIIEERKITCGDAYAFQGDERDVMFLSMVKALDSNNINDTVKALTDKGTSQRFNVAATRARDQVFLFHSIPVAEFKNPDDWRLRLLNSFYNPRTEEIKAGRESLRKEFDSGRASQFSLEVGNILIDRGYQVLPEYPVIGYRIDLVVQGLDARLAIECDGDQYHTLEKWEEDQVRERQLRRAGWEFWRVTGSSFYRNKEKALDSLWVKLDELGIKPII